MSLRYTEGIEDNAFALKTGSVFICVHLCSSVFSVDFFVNQAYANCAKTGAWSEGRSSLRGSTSIVQLLQRCAKVSVTRM